VAVRRDLVFPRHSRLTSLAEKSRLPAAFGACPIGHGLPFPVSLLLEPAVNEGAHQGAGRDAAPEAVAAQAQVGLLFEPHGHRLVAQRAHRHPPAYTSSPQLADPEDRCPHCFVLHGALDVSDSNQDEVGKVVGIEREIGPEGNAIGPEEVDEALDAVL
jgi:hypothetical protein